MSFLLFFTPYVNSFERRVHKFMRKLRDTSNKEQVEKELTELMQKNVVMLSLWLEKKYKNYLHLKKRTRRQMHSNLARLEQLFLEIVEQNTIKEKELSSLGLDFPEQYQEEIKYIKQIMLFLKPGKLFQYRASSNLGRLLADPKKEKLIGDCNQIVTLYIHLYSLKYPISELQIKILKNHVCLHFKGIDIEATTGQFKKYNEYEHILSITEIISTNLLDISDVEAKQAKISAESLLQASKLAFVISSLRDLVTKNLKIAYHNCGIQAIKAKNFETAIFCFKQIPDHKSLQTAYHNGAVHFANKKNFEKANYFASQTKDEKLKKNLKELEAHYYFKKNNFDKARALYSVMGNSEMVKNCYKQELYILSQKIKHVKTVQQAKQHQATYQKMVNVAEKGELSDSARHYRDILRKL